jgi:hypothetical protein
MKQEDEIIKEIIEAFETFALGDIEHNVDKKPIAAFILCSCLIDQLAAFRYNEPTEKNRVLYKRFINDYMSHYKSLNLYVNLRCKLVHNYTVGKYIQLTSEEAPYEKLGLSKNIKVLTAKMMHNELKIVFDKIKNELLTPDSETRKNAIGQYKHENSQIIGKKTHKFTSYTEEHADTLIKHFTPILCKKFRVNNENVEIVSLTKQAAQPGRCMLIVNSIHGRRGKTKQATQIDVVINAFQLPSADSVLNRLSHIQYNALPSGDTDEF